MEVIRGVRDEMTHCKGYTPDGRGETTTMSISMLSVFS